MNRPTIGLVRPASRTTQRADDRSTNRLSSEVLLGARATTVIVEEIDDLVERCGAPATAGAAWLAPGGSGVIGGRTWLVAVRDEDRRLCAALALADRARGERDLVTLAGAGSSQVSTLLSESPAASALLGHAFAEAMTARPRPTMAALGPLDSDHGALADFVWTVPGGELVDVEGVPIIRRGASRTATDYLSESMRRTLRKAANRAQSDGIEVAISTTTAYAEVLALLPQLERLHRERDHAQGRPSDLDDPTLLWLWRSRLIGLARQSRLELAALRIDGTLAAYVAGIPDRSAYRVLEGMLVTRFSRYSPGRVLETAVLQRVLDDPRYEYLDWMSSVASETLLATNDLRPVSLVRAAFAG